MKKRDWWSASVIAIVLVTALAVSQAVFASGPSAPGIDPATAFVGLGVAGGVAAILLEGLSRKSKKS